MFDFLKRKSNSFDINSGSTSLNPTNIDSNMPVFSANNYQMQSQQVKLKRIRKRYMIYGFLLIIGLLVANEFVQKQFKDQLKGCQTFTDRFELNSFYNSPNINYHKERSGKFSGYPPLFNPLYYYFIYKPENYSAQKKSGLLIYLPTDDVSLNMLPGWQEVCDKLNLVYMCPQYASATNRNPNESCNKIIYGTLAMLKNYNIDKNRIYLVGFSGCARTCCDLGFYQNDLFKKIIGVCGAQFYRKVNTVATTMVNDTKGNFYGLNTATASEVKEAKKDDHFVFITGSKDFRRGNILDIYNEGYKKDGFKADLIFINDLANQPISGAVLEEAIQKVSK